MSARRGVRDQHGGCDPDQAQAGGAGSVEQFQQGRFVVALDEARGSAHPQPGMAGGGVLDQVLQRLRDRRGRVQAQELQHGLGILARVERAPDRGDREPVDRGRALAFGVGHGEELFGQFRCEVAGRHGGEVRLEQHVVQGRRQVFAQDPHRLVGLLGGDRRPDLAERARADQAEHLRLGQDSPDQGAETPGHPRLGPVGALQHGRGVQDRRLPVRGARPPGSVQPGFPGSVSGPPGRPGAGLRPRAR